MPVLKSTFNLLFSVVNRFIDTILIDTILIDSVFVADRGKQSF